MKKRENIKIMETKTSTEWTMSDKCKYLAIVKNDNNKYVIVMGDAQVSPKEFDTIEQAEEYIDKPNANFICELTITTIFLSYENKNKKQTQKVVEESAKSNA